MTILFLDQFADLGGAQFCLLDLVLHLRRLGWQLHVGLPAEGTLARRIQEQGAVTHLLNFRKYNSGHKTPLDVYRFLEDVRAGPRHIRDLGSAVRPDLIYVNGPRLMPLVALAGMPAPLIFHSHNQVTFLNGRPAVAWAIEKTSASVIAASDFVRGQWKRGVTVYSGVNGSPPRDLKKTAGSCRIGLVGRISPQKRQRDFIAAATMVSRQLPGCEFLVCGSPRFGDRNDERYRDRILRACPDNVQFTGWREPVHEILRELDLLVIPSCNEGGVPRVLLEAFACSVPVLARDSGAVPEVLKDRVNGYLLRSGEISVMADRIVEIISRPADTARIALNAQELWREHFTVDAYVDQVMTTINETLNRGNCVSPVASGSVHSRSSVREPQ